MREFRMLAAMMLLAGGLMGFSCGPEGVGDPCVPEDEYGETFQGFSVAEVNVESRSFSCVTRICLVNHFQGRVSCPYGQTDETAELCAPAADTNAPGSAACADPNAPEYKTSCRKPGADGLERDERIIGKVEPQFADRQADDAVYCSCRCDGPDAGARYCEDVPDGFSCEKLVDDIGLGKGQLAGSYCVKSGTEYSPTRPPSKLCNNEVPGQFNCGSEGSNPPLL